MDQIPFFTLTRQYQQHRDNILRITDEVFQSGQMTKGPAVEHFEKRWAEFCGTGEAVMVCNGSAALELVLEAMGIGNGDEVIVPAFTYVAVPLAVHNCGARPVFADVKPETANINPDLVQSLIGKRTKALIGVHMYGQLLETETIQNICKQNGLYFIEDASQAHGASDGVQQAGSFGTAAVFSFYPTKNLGAYGEGGVVTTNDGDFAGLLRSLRNQGSVPHDPNKTVYAGYNRRMETLQAAVLNYKLDYLEAWNARRQKIAARYLEGLKDSSLALPQWRQTAYNTHVFHLFVVGCADRDTAQKTLQQAGIQTAVHYPVPCHLQPALNGLGYKSGDFPEAEKLASKVLSLPMFPELKNEEIEEVVETLKNLSA